MISKTGKPNSFLIDKVGFSGFAFLDIIAKALFILTVILFYTTTALCQCAGRNAFQNNITAIYNSSAKTTDIQLKELLKVQEQMKICRLEMDSTYMYLLQKIGILYLNQTNYPAAIEYTKRAVMVAMECLKASPGNALALVDNYYNLFYSYGVSGQMDKKYDAIDSCIVYFLKGNKGATKAVAALEDKTDYLFNKGEYNLCNENARLGQEIVEKYYHEADSITYLVSFVMRQVNGLRFTKDLSAAEKLVESKMRQLEGSGNRNQLYPFYNALGLINIDKGDYQKALAYFQQGYKNSLLIKFKKGYAENLLSIGTLYAKYLNKYDIGLQYCGRALKYAEATDSLLILTQAGAIYAMKKDFAKAQYFFQRAYNIVDKGLDETTLLRNSFEFPGFNLLQSLSDLTTAKGDAYLQQYYSTRNAEMLKKALNVYKKNDLFLIKIKTEQQLQPASSLVWRTTAHNLYEHAIEACYANENIEDAFYFFEKSRAVLLNDQINEQRWMADTDIARQAILKKTIEELKRELASLATSSQEYISIQKDLYTNSQELDVLIRDLKKKNPAFYQRYLDTVYLNVEQLRKNILERSKTLVEIFSGDSMVYVLIITGTDHALTRINKKLYDSIVTRFNNFLGNPDVMNKDFIGFGKTAYQLYNMLFQNIKPGDGSMIISPDGLSYPFEALIIKPGNIQPVYFVNQYATSYTYSVKYLTNLFAGNNAENNKVLGIAPVHYDNKFNLSALQGSEHSLDIINHYFTNGTNYLFAKATKNNFLQNFPKYNIIQLYTHALGNSTNNNDPIIYFSDSALYLSDLIPNQKPVTQLVILSACETAKGKLYEGEGIFSFNRGFAALGIPAAISNLWSVNNESTYAITELFYKYLSKGLPTDIALQKAKLEFMNSASSGEKKFPYFWAASILTGRVDTIKADASFPWGKLMGATILLSVAVYLSRKFFLQKKRSNLV